MNRMIFGKREGGREGARAVIGMASTATNVTECDPNDVGAGSNHAAPPPTKKRVNERQLTKDDDGYSDDEHGATGAGGDVADAQGEGKGFAKASEDVLRGRKIVKVRRPAGATAAGDAGPAASKPSIANPFTCIAPDTRPKVQDAPSLTNGAAADESGEGARASAGGGDGPVPSAAGDDEEEGGAAEQKPKTSGFGGFGSSGGGFGSGFGSSSVSGVEKGSSIFGGGGGGFGSFAANGGGFGAGTATAFNGQGDNGNSGKTLFAFAQTTPLFGVASDGGGAQDSPSGGAEGAEAAAAVPSSDAGPAKAKPTLELKSVKTGEEEERTLFQYLDAKLFEYSDEKGVWRECGAGEIRIKQSEEDAGRCRIVMRNKGNLRLVLNTSIPSKVSEMNVKAVCFCCCNHAVSAAGGANASNAGGEQSEKVNADESLRKAEMRSYGVRFRDRAQKEDFQRILQEQIDRAASASRDAAKEGAQTKADEAV